MEVGCTCKVVEAPGKAGGGVGSPEWNVKTRDSSNRGKIQSKSEEGWRG